MNQFISLLSESAAHVIGFGRVTAIFALSAFALGAGSAFADDRADATNLLRGYERELNAGNSAAIVALYTADGVFMPSGAPTATGSTELQGAYAAVFTAIKLKVVFIIDELEIHGDIAFARTTSRGQVTVLADGRIQAEENRELYLFNQPRR
jgi:ketosteroid isomerase-like protein